MNNFSEKNTPSKALLLFLLPVFLISSSGCFVKTYTVMKDRPDQIMEGNQGFLMGESPQRKVTKHRKRKTYVTEIEFSKYQSEHNEVVSQQEEAVDYYILEETPIVLDPLGSNIQEESLQGVTRYTVKKGDTLEKIAARPEVYNNRNRWNRIYKANKATIKNPDRIKPGQVLKIPR